jgi:L-galactose dehydrogenase
MEKRILGKTGLELPILSFGASSLGAEFRSVQLDEIFESVRVALELGLNFIDTSPFYGRGMSEVLLGIALRGVPRDQYTLCSKLGRYDVGHFDFSANRVAESVDDLLERHELDVMAQNRAAPANHRRDIARPASYSAIGQSSIRRHQRLSDEDF